MHIAKRYRISQRLSTSDTILFVAVYEEVGQGTDFTGTPKNKNEVAACVEPASLIQWGLSSLAYRHDEKLAKDRNLIGALLALWMVARRGNPPDIWIEHAARRVSRLAFWSVIALVVTGTYTAYNGLGFDLNHLLFSAYGCTLIAKVIVFAGILGIGAYNPYWLVPKVSETAERAALLRNVQIEIGHFAVCGCWIDVASSQYAPGPWHGRPRRSTNDGDDSCRSD